MQCMFCKDLFDKSEECPICSKLLSFICLECHYETVHGIIVDMNISMTGGGPVSPGYKDDPGPSWENSIRALEDTRK